MFSTSILQTQHLNNVRLLIKTLFREYPLYQRKRKYNVMTTSWFSPKSVDISPNIYYNLGESRGAWEKGDGGSDERI